MLHQITLQQILVGPPLNSTVLLLYVHPFILGCTAYRMKKIKNLYLRSQAEKPSASNIQECRIN